MASATQTSNNIDQTQQVPDIERSNGSETKYKIDETIKERFKDDIRELLDVKDSDKYKAISNEIRVEYDSFFRDVIETVRLDTNTTILTDIETNAAIDYIFIETIKDEKYKHFQNSHNSSDTTDVNFIEMIGIQTAHATCPATTNPNYKQVKIDIDGGIHYSHSYNGDNDLIKVEYRDNNKTCKRTFYLTFQDEDHPRIDALYDQIRQRLYGRIMDIESFVIENNRIITFDNTWSSTNSFNCLFLGTAGCHATTSKAYMSGQTIYVSNTWNHMMDTVDTNSRLKKVNVP